MKCLNMILIPVVTTALMGCSGFRSVNPVQKTDVSQSLNSFGINDRPFDTSKVYIVDRSSTKIYEVLSALGNDSIRPLIMIFGSRDNSTRGAELKHMLSMLTTKNSLIWVSEQAPPNDLTPTLIQTPDEVIKADKIKLITSSGESQAYSSAPARGHPIRLPTKFQYVFCAESQLQPVCALAAMRLGYRLTLETPNPTSEAISAVVQIGGTSQSQDYSGTTISYQFWGNAVQAEAELNKLASRPAVMVTKKGAVKPEHILYAYYRDVHWLEVNVPNYSNLNLRSEQDATYAVRDQVSGFLSSSPLFYNRLPDALVIAGGWLDIPYRFARSTTYDFSPCSDCDNKFFAYSSDVEYTNIDRDIWGQPDFASGRLMSYDDDLLSIQSLVGYLSDMNALTLNAPESVYAEMFPTETLSQQLGYLAQIFSGRFWKLFGPRDWDDYQTYSLDQTAFFNDVDISDKVVFNGHGWLNYLGTGKLQLDGDRIARTRLTATPSFWFIYACSTVKFADPGLGWEYYQHDNKNLLSGIQSRSAFGSYMSVEIVAQGAMNPLWLMKTASRGLSVGENIRLAEVGAIKFYRGDSDAPDVSGFSLAQRTNTDVDLANAWISEMWVGDPLTIMK